MSTDGFPPYSNGTTSMEAAASIEDAQANLLEMVFGHVFQHGAHGATCAEVEEALDMRHQTASPRLWQLAKMTPPRVVMTSRKRTNPSGRSAHVYVVTGFATPDELRETRLKRPPAAALTRAAAELLALSWVGDDVRDVAYWLASLNQPKVVAAATPDKSEDASEDLTSPT